MYIIVNAVTQKPIQAIGFCSAHTTKAAADEAARRWNAKPEWMHACKAAVVEK